MKFAGIMSIDDLLERYARTKTAYLDISKDRERIDSYENKDTYRIIQDNKFSGNIIILYNDLSKDKTNWNFTVSNISDRHIFTLLIKVEQETHNRPYEAFLTRAQQSLSKGTQSQVGIVKSDDSSALGEYNIKKEEKEGEKFNIYDVQQPEIGEDLQLQQEEKWNKMQPEKNE